MTNTLSNLSCETLFNMYRQYVENLQSMVNDARTMLRNITNLVAFPFNRINAMVQEYMSALNGLPGLLDFSNLAQVLNALKRMLDCPILADAFGKQISNIIDNVGKGAAALRSMITSLLSSIADKVRSALEPIQKMLQEPLSKLTGAFDKFVGSTLGPVMSYLHMLEQCLGNMCAAYKAIQSFSPGAIVKPLEKFGVSFSGGKMSFDSKSMMNAMTRKVTDMKNRAVQDFDSMQKATKKQIDDTLSLANSLESRAKSAMKLPKLKAASTGG